MVAKSADQGPDPSYHHHQSADQGPDLMQIHKLSVQNDGQKKKN